MTEAWKARTGMLIGDGGIEKLRASTVAVVGIGGVGAYAAEMIVRAGVGHMVIVDSDTVSESNINRQLPALHSTVGRLKTEVLAERLTDINPGLDLAVVPEYLLADSVSPESGLLSETTAMPEHARKAEDILGGFDLDFVVDAIDTLSPKISLIEYCLGRGIPLVSSMGAGAKYDVTKVRITDISESFRCPLAFMVRKKLHKKGIRTGFKAVFSEEAPDERAIVPDEGANKRSIVGTISYLPAVFGCACAQAAIGHLLGK